MLIYIFIFLFVLIMLLAGNFIWVVIPVLVGVGVGSISYYLKSNQRNKASNSIMGNPKFQNAKRIDGWLNHFILISEKGDIYLYPSKRFLSIKDINSYKINVDGSSQGGLGRAAVGGLLFGGAGAIVGGVTANKSKIKKISVIFNINDFNAPIEEFLILDYLTDESSNVHRGAQNTINTLFGTLEFVEEKLKSNN